MINHKDNCPIRHQQQLHLQEIMSDLRLLMDSLDHPVLHPMSHKMVSLDLQALHQILLQMDLKDLQDHLLRNKTQTKYLFWIKQLLLLFNKTTQPNKYNLAKVSLKQQINLPKLLLNEKTLFLQEIQLNGQHLVQLQLTKIRRNQLD